MKTLLDKETRQRNTARRTLLLDIIQNAKGHLDADELYWQARQRQPSLSLSTVYRNLRLFMKLGLVEEHQFAGVRHYEAKAKNRHHHLVCLGCGQVVEFHCLVIDKVTQEVGKEKGFVVTEAEVHLAGYCPACRERMMAEATSKQEVVNK